MFLPQLDVRLQERDFRVESIEVAVEETTIYTFRVWEGDTLLNAEELIECTFDIYTKAIEAVDGGFLWLRRYLKQGARSKE